METIDDETVSAAKDFLQKQAKMGNRFFVGGMLLGCIFEHI